MKSNIKAEFKPDSLDLINFIISHFRVFLVTGILAAVMSASDLTADKTPV